MWGTIITVLDYAMLLFYIYAGLSLRNWLVLIFALTQIVPLAWWEFGVGASHALEHIKPAFPDRQSLGFNGSCYFDHWFADLHLCYSLYV